MPWDGVAIPRVSAFSYPIGVRRVFHDVRRSLPTYSNLLSVTFVIATQESVCSLTLFSDVWISCWAYQRRLSVQDNEPDEAVRVHGQDKGHGDRQSKSPTQGDAKSLNPTNIPVTENILVITRRAKVALSRSRTVVIPQGALAAKRPTRAKMATIHKGVVPRLSRAKRHLPQWPRTCSIRWRWQAWWNSSSNRAGENAVAPQAHPQAQVDRIHHRHRPILTLTPTTKRHCSRSDGRNPTRRHEDSRARGHEAARPGCKQDGTGSDSDDPFNGLNAIQAANHSNNESDYTHGFQDTIRDMESFETGDKMGNRINDTFASIFSSSLRRRPNDKALLDTADKYPRPVNVPNLAVPKTNDVIWERMQKGPQIVDAHLQ